MSFSLNFNCLVFLLLQQLVLAQSGVVHAPSGIRNYPPVNSVPRSNPRFNARYELSNVPNIPVSSPRRARGPPDCDGSNQGCSWTCNQCVRSTDIRECGGNRDWAMSFDDGPTIYSIQVVNELSRRNLTASFFLVGSEVIQNPSIVLRLYEEGHHIAVHTWSHRALTSLTNEEIIAELEWTAIAIQNVIGVRPTYFRPPFGDIDDRVRVIAGAMGLRPVLWNYDSGDWILNNNSLIPDSLPGSNETETESQINSAAAQMISSMASASSSWKSRSSGILSLHHDRSEATVAQAGPSIDAILSNGMNIISVAQCLADDYPYHGTVSIEEADVDTDVSIEAEVPDSDNAISASNDSVKADPLGTNIPQSSSDSFLKLAIISALISILTSILFV